MRRATAVAIAVVLTSACSDPGRLAERDPAGAEACAELARALAATEQDDVDVVDSAYASGRAALEATTPEIRAATVRLSGDAWPDVAAMVGACRSEGVQMPDGTGLPTG